MITHRIPTSGAEIHAVEHPGPGPVVVFLHAIGTDHHLWDHILPLLPQEGRYVCLDLRGHGQSSAPKGPYGMGALVRDVETVCDHLALRDVTLVGLSLGGLVAQGLAAKRLDLVRALVLSNTAAKIGTRALWEERAATVRAKGLVALAPMILARWFARAALDAPYVAPLRDTLCATSSEGYAACCEAIAGTDFITPTSGLRLPTLAIASSNDRATPPDMVRETADLIPGSQFHLIRRAAHLPCIDAPDAYAQALHAFLTSIGELSGAP